MLNFCNRRTLITWNVHSLEWTAQRVTLLILLPITLLFFWFLFLNSSTQTIWPETINCTNLVMISCVTLWETLLAANSNLGSIWAVLVATTTAFMVISTLIHLALGVENMIYDYVHHEKTRRLSIFLNRLVQIEACRCLYIYIIFV